MRICIDIDGTLCEFRSPTGGYESVRPLPQVAEFVRARKAEGHTIILQTARHMKTCSGNVGMVIARQGAILYEWLKKYDIPYDELYFGKPNADIYIDDNALEFNGNWAELEKSRAWERRSAEKSGLMNIVVTMAGAGSRFKAAGYEVPKPLIPVFGEPMYRHSVRCLPLQLAKRLIFVIRKDEYVDELRKDIANNFAKYNPRIVEIDHLTRGQAESFLYSEPELAFNIPTLIHNADSAFISHPEIKFQDICHDVDGALFVFDSDDARYSYASLEDNGRVNEVREKKVISRHASTGTYYFRSTVQLVNLIQDAVKNNDVENGEYYLGPLYNRMIAARQLISVVPVSRFICYGTPQELREVEADPAAKCAIEKLIKN